MKKNKKRIKKCSLENEDSPIKILNKRILKERAKTKKGKIALIAFFIVVTSPLWLYAGIVRGIFLPSFGERTKGILTGINKPSSWNKYRYVPCYYCSFNANGKIYESYPTVSVRNTSFHLGDTVDVIYFKRFPFINAIKLPKEKK